MFINTWLKVITVCLLEAPPENADAGLRQISALFAQRGNEPSHTGIAYRPGHRMEAGTVSYVLFHLGWPQGPLRLINAR